MVLFYELNGELGGWEGAGGGSMGVFGGLWGGLWGSVGVYGVAVGLYGSLWGFWGFYGVLGGVKPHCFPPPSTNCGVTGTACIAWRCGTPPNVCRGGRTAP